MGKVRYFEMDQTDEKKKSSLGFFFIAVFSGIAFCFLLVTGFDILKAIFLFVLRFWYIPVALIGLKLFFRYIIRGKR